MDLITQIEELLVKLKDELKKEPNNQSTNNQSTINKDKDLKQDLKQFELDQSRLAKLEEQQENRKKIRKIIREKGPDGIRREYERMKQADEWGTDY